MLRCMCLASENALRSSGYQEMTREICRTLGARSEGAHLPIRRRRKRPQPRVERSGISAKLFWRFFDDT
jgi:hypothetical protein